MVCEDSFIIVNQVRKVEGIPYQTLILILHRIKLILTHFEKVEIYHIKKNLNTVADSLANQGVFLEQGVMTVNNE